MHDLVEVPCLWTLSILCRQGQVSQGEVEVLFWSFYKYESHTINPQPYTSPHRSCSLRFGMQL